jgi:hypothetical protein
MSGSSPHEFDFGATQKALVDWRGATCATTKPRRVSSHRNRSWASRRYGASTSFRTSCTTSNWSAGIRRGVQWVHAYRLHGLGSVRGTVRHRAPGVVQAGAQEGHVGTGVDDHGPALQRHGVHQLFQFEAATRTAFSSSASSMRPRHRPGGRLATLRGGDAGQTTLRPMLLPSLLPAGSDAVVRTAGSGGLERHT